MTKRKLQSAESRIRSILEKDNGPPDIPEDKIPYHQKYSTGYEQGLFISEENHKEVIYRMIMDLYGRQKN
jgi:hypothetical protein